MVFNLTHAQVILRYKENGRGGRIEPYTIVIISIWFNFTANFFILEEKVCVMKLNNHYFISTS
jgi:hypothetical protein